MSTEWNSLEVNASSNEYRKSFDAALQDYSDADDGSQGIMEDTPSIDEIESAESKHSSSYDDLADPEECTEEIPADTEGLSDEEGLRDESPLNKDISIEKSITAAAESLDDRISLGEGISLDKDSSDKEIITDSKELNAAIQANKDVFKEIKRSQNRNGETS